MQASCHWTYKSALKRRIFAMNFLFILKENSPLFNLEKCLWIHTPDAILGTFLGYFGYFLGENGSKL